MKNISFLTVLLSLFYSSSAFTAMLRYEFEGLITSTPTVLNDYFSTGDTLAGYFNVDTAGLQQSSRTIYEASNLSVTIANSYYLTGSSGSFIVNANQFFDGYSLSFSNSSGENVTGDPINGVTPGYFDIQLDWFSGNSPITSQSLLDIFPTNSSVTDRSNINFPSDSERLSYELTSLRTVPLPASIWFLGSGLLLMVGFSRKDSSH